MAWYTVTKRINGRKYLYLQLSYRQGGKVKTRSQYLGPASDDGNTHAPDNLPTVAYEQREAPLNTYIGRLTTKSSPKPIVDRKPRRKKRPGRKRTPIPKSLPSDGDYSGRFWDTPRSATRLAQQAKLFHLAHQKLEARYNKRSLVERLASGEARREKEELTKLQEAKDHYQTRDTTRFDRQLIYTKRGVRLTRPA